METGDLSSAARTGKVLFIGDVGRVFLRVDAVRELPCEVCTNMLDAIDAAGKNSFAAVAVVMSGSCSNLSSALKALREVASNARIVLLAQMYEEPVAMRLVGLTSNGTNLADDYLICPLEATGFCEAIMSGVGQRLGEASVAGTIGGWTEARIRQLEKLATEDEVTGLKNRRYVWEFSRQIIEHAKRSGQRVTLLLFDIDNLKSYNDVYGHLAGDEVLRQAAVLMRRCCRQHDVVARIGGDEFAVVFWGGPGAGLGGSESERRSAAAEHPKEAISIAKRFQEELKTAGSHLLGPEGRGILTISGGLASLPRDGSTIEELFRQADKALLEAKRNGKNKIYLVGRPESDIADIE